VAGDHCGPSDLIIAHDHSQPARIIALIEDDDPGIGGEQLLHHPGADKPVRTGYQEGRIAKCRNVQRGAFCHISHFASFGATICLTCSLIIRNPSSTFSSPSITRCTVRQSTSSTSG